MTLSVEDVVFKARALAQSHALTPLATRYVNRAIVEQRTSQPVPEIGIWAGHAIVNGYCVRRVEEDEAGLTLAARSEPEPDLDELEARAAAIAADLRTDGASAHLLAGDGETLISALDRIIAGEIERRLEHWRDDIDDQAWGELEEYITWWVVKGYALRAAEMAVGALA